MLKPNLRSLTSMKCCSPTQLFWGICLITVLGSGAANAQKNWPQFRGPGSAGVSRESGLPDRWSRTKNIVWRTELPGLGWSSPIVWEDRIFITTVISERQEEETPIGIQPNIGDRGKPSKNRRRWVVFCFSLEKGDLIWEREVHAGFPDWPRHVKNSYASETPCADGQRVYAYFGNVGLFAFSMDGTPVWERHWDRYKTRGNWGSAASPILHQGKLYLVNDNEEHSFIEAMDCLSGNTLWKTDRKECSNWSTPFIWENQQRTEIVTPGTGKTRSYDLAGNQLWEFSGISSITVPTPFSGHDLVYVGSGFNGSRLRPLYAIREGASGDISLAKGETSNRFIAWRQPKAAAYNVSPILLGDQIYGLLDRGTLASWDARTGEEIYPFQRIDPKAKAFTVSPWAYDGKIFCLSENGDTFVIQAGPDMKVLAKNSLGEMCMSSPALVPSALILRTTEALYRIGESASLE